MRNFKSYLRGIFQFTFRFFKNEPLLFLFLLLLIFLSVSYPKFIADYISFVEWRTILALAALFLVTMGIGESGYFTEISYNLVEKLKDERSFAIFLVILSAALSTFLTNDIALFIVVPLTIKMLSTVKNELYRVVIFEAIAVNVGSLLTPIGNPQNLYLWTQMKVSFIAFVLKMMPLFVLMIAILMAFVIFLFPKRKIDFKEYTEGKGKSRRLFIVSLILLILFVFLLNIGVSIASLLAVFLVYLILLRKLIQKVDWAFLLLFIVIFVDFGIISKISVIIDLMSKINIGSNGNVFLVSIFLSQVMSNVPATVFITNFTGSFVPIAYGVNVGGNGLIIASMANIIAMRMIRNKKIWVQFHKYSISFLTISSVLAYVIFFL